MNTRYKALEAIIFVLYGLAFLTLILTGYFVIVAFQTQSFVSGIVLLIGGAFAVTLIMALAQLIEVFIDIGENSHKTVELLQHLNNPVEPPEKLKIGTLLNKR